MINGNFENTKNIVPLQKWCESELSSVAWIRILISNVESIRDYGYDFNGLQNPDEKLLIQNELFDLLVDSIKRTYEKTYAA